jgi:DNA-binding XRE family transcriptional regulator
MDRNVRINREHLGGSLEELKQRLMEEPVFRLGWRLYDMAGEIGRVATQMRRRAKLTQTELADRLGVRQSMVSRLESDHPDRMPTFATVARVADACGYEMEVVLRPKSDYREGREPLEIHSRDYVASP